jgi:serine/threonine protein kinase
MVPLVVKGVGGEVMSGEWRIPGQRPCNVAIKRVELTGLGIESNRQVAELVREMKFLSALDHPNIVRFYGIIYEEGDMEIGLVTELMVGTSAH